MKKTLLILVIILAVILALPVINLLRWTFQGKKPMDIILVDKTVPTLKRENHRSISWVLTNGRYVDKENKSNYSYSKDYYGWFPLRPERDHEYEIHDYRLAEVIDLADKNDVLYIADTYGVFFNDWYRGINKSRRSRKLFGGLNNTDYLLFKEMKDRNRLIIMEYNTFDYPTDVYNAYRVQERLGITFSGWSGKYFASLDTTTNDFPIWMTGQYRKEHKKPWTFTKAGVVLVSQKNIIVLEEGKEIKDPMPYITTSSENVEKYGVVDTVAFNNWFDIIDPVACNVLSSYDLRTTAEGDSLLMKYNLSNTFPAVIQELTTPSVYYFAGNFAYSDKPVWTSMFKGIEKFKRIHYTEKTNDPNRFFWLYYKPLVSTLFNDYYATIKK
ncbi:MAG TPA: hypothetical protein VK213_07945 [Bacteroidales bacterium]|nr:hypothetical protein [Bacteroidales bacterium]